MPPGAETAALEAPIRTRRVACGVCGRRETTFLLQARDRLHGVPGDYTYVRCAGCGVVYMNPQVVPEDLERLYPASYEPFHLDGRRSSSRARAAARRIPWLGRVLQETLSPAALDETLAGSLSPASRWLDVGCGSGAFLQTVRERVGCEVVGVDVSETSVAVAKNLFGIDVVHGTITDAPFEDGSFDVVSGWWYLEHVPNPREAVQKISALLKDGGTCMLGVPNASSANSRVFGARWYHLDCPRHLYLWTRRSLTRLLAEHSLEVTRVAYDKNPWGLIGSLQYALHGGVHADRRDLRKSRVLFGALVPWTALTALARVSDTIVVYARKRRRCG